MIDLSTLEWAEQEVAARLGMMGTRWLHVKGVVSLAREISTTLGDSDACLLISAAYLHDIGYAPSLIKTGFHPLDGARYLRSLHQEHLACLVAHHSQARFEAELRGLSAELSDFPREHSALADALDYCDQLTGPSGTPMTLRERKADILARYGESHVVSVAYRRALPYLALAIGRTRRRLTSYSRVSVS